MEEKGITFDVLSDPGNRIAEEFGLAFQIPQDLREVQSSLGLDLAVFNGDDSWTLPTPSRFIIDQKGIVRSKVVDPDLTIRPEPGETLAELRKLFG